VEEGVRIPASTGPHLSWAQDQRKKVVLQTLALLAPSRPFASHHPLVGHRVPALEDLARL